MIIETKFYDDDLHVSTSRVRLFYVWPLTLWLYPSKCWCPAKFLRLATAVNGSLRTWDQRIWMKASCGPQAVKWALCLVVLLFCADLKTSSRTLEKRWEEEGALCCALCSDILSFCLSPFRHFHCTYIDHQSLSGLGFFRTVLSFKGCIYSGTEHQTCNLSVWKHSSPYVVTVEGPSLVPLPRYFPYHKTVSCVPLQRPLVSQACEVLIFFYTLQEHNKFFVCRL